MTKGKIWLHEIVVAIWACASFPITHVTVGENAVPLFVPLVAGVIALISLTYNKPVIATVSPLVSLGGFWLNLSIITSYLFNAERYDCIFTIGHLLSFLLLFFTLYLITTRIDLDFRKTLIVCSILINLFLPVILLTSPTHWGRLDPNETPNYVGMMALLAFIGALGLRSKIWATALSVLPLYSMVALQSRDSLLATAITIIFGLGSWFWNNRNYKHFIAYVLLALLGSVAFCGALCLAGVPVFESIGQAFEGLTMLNDKYRGINSGGSGRGDLWAAAIEIWWTHPIFGVGFKAHQMLMPDHLWAHNSFLALLADMGLAGFIGYLLTVSPAVYFVCKPIHRYPGYPQWATVILTYLMYGLFEARAFNFGNTYSVVFLLVVFNCSKRAVVETLPIQPRARVVVHPLSNPS